MWVGFKLTSRSDRVQRLSPVSECKTQKLSCKPVPSRLVLVVRETLIGGVKAWKGRSAS